MYEYNKAARRELDDHIHPLVVKSYDRERRKYQFVLASYYKSETNKNKMLVPTGKFLLFFKKKMTVATIRVFYELNDEKKSKSLVITTADYPLTLQIRLKLDTDIRLKVFLIHEDEVDEIEEDNFEVLYWMKNDPQIILVENIEKATSVLETILKERNRRKRKREKDDDDEYKKKKQRVQ